MTLQAPLPAEPGRLRSFDPVEIGRLEAAAWAAYYRRQWPRLLLVTVALIHRAFGMDWPRAVHGSWLVLRANQLWAPSPANDPDGARRCMRRFYAYLYDVGEAAVWPAAEQRAAAMSLSDEWVARGCPPGSALLPATRAALVRGYAALLAAVHH